MLFDNAKGTSSLAWCVSMSQLYAFWLAQRLDRERTLHAGIFTTTSVSAGWDRKEPAQS